MIPLSHQDRERFIFALVIGLVLNVALFLVIEILVKLDAARPPKDFADLQVELQVEEVPVIDRVAEAEPPKVVEPRPVAEPAPAPPPPAEPEVKVQAPAPKPAAPKPEAPRPVPPKPVPPEPVKEEPIKDEYRIPSGPVAAAAAPPAPSTPQFRTEGAKPASAPAPAPPAPTKQKAQPLTEPAPAESAPALPRGPSQKVVQGQAQSSAGSTGGSVLPLNQLDEALGAGGGAPAAPAVPEGQTVSGGGRLAAAGQAPAGLPATRSAAGPGVPGEQPFQISWEDPAQGRKPVRTPIPDLPPQAKQGQRLTVVVEFILTPQGFISTVNRVRSSGYTEVDTAVVNAVRKWTFEPVRSDRSVKGQVTYTIVSG